ncbi:hypothetical protein [uncultured Adlercreutzia sp.]|uniref:hypothetical protein n=1 Tax=uncultured Adlercreutzia sp. TaxID=875803 RepID=UPI00266BF041|nr:hypothetical protein [uncultured Adlercreutzia sp.]
MAKKDLRAQMDAARAAAAFIDAAHDEREASSEREGEKAGEVAETSMERAEAEGASKIAREATGERGTAVDSAVVAPDKAAEAPSKPKAARARKPRKKSAEAATVVEMDEGAGARMTAQVLVPMTAEQREHADLLASVMKITRAEVMRQALDEYWESHKAELQAAVAAYEELIKKLMK